MWERERHRLRDSVRVSRGLVAAVWPTDPQPLSTYRRTSGRLTDTQVRHLLPPKKAEGNVVALLAGKTEGLDSRWHELAERLRCEKAKRDAEAEDQRLRKAAEFNARRQAVLNALEASANG